MPLIFDEVVTGFRLAYGGAQAFYGVTPDICTMGKVIGGGFPLAAVAGRAEIMAHFDRARAGDAFMPQIGTLSGNPVAAAAGLATMAILRRPGSYDRLFATGAAIRAALEGALRDAGLTAVVSGEPIMFDAFFTDRPAIRNHADALTGDAARSRAFNAAVRERGVFKSDGKIYVSLAHDEADVAQAATAFAEAAQVVAAA